jgi:hypothetical protein
MNSRLDDRRYRDSRMAVETESLVLAVVFSQGVENLWSLKTDKSSSVSGMRGLYGALILDDCSIRCVGI